MPLEGYRFGTQAQIILYTKTPRRALSSPPKKAKGDQNDVTSNGGKSKTSILKPAPKLSKGQSTLSKYFATPSKAETATKRKA